MDLDKRIGKLERVVEGLVKEINILKKQYGDNDDNEWRNNTVDDYMIKLFYPGIYCQKDNPTAGFPKNRRGISEKIYPGQYMFIYVASPIKKIVGLTKVTSTVKENVGSRWPYYVDLEWIIKPRNGVSFKECGLDIRPRPGDTLYAINKDKAKEIINKLEAQKELDNSTIDYLANEYRHIYDEK